MVLGILLLLAGLTISAVAIYYSVLGLAAIFAAAAIPIYIMGGALEISKLIAASWLKANWHRATGFIKWYMTSAVVILMFITSMGIFGFLSAAHLNQSVPAGDIAAQVELIDEKIKTQRENIEASKVALSQLDAQVNQRLSGSDTVQSAERSIQIRRQQQSERNKLQTEIATAQKEIIKLNEEKSPIAKDLRKIEAEVGPIKYIAQFVYGQEADKNLLEKAVTWVIILLVVVFDPLAIAMLLAAQMTVGWYRKDKDQESVVNDTGNANIISSNQDNTVHSKLDSEVDSNVAISELSEQEPTEDVQLNPEYVIDKHPYLSKKFNHFENLTPIVAPQIVSIPEVRETFDHFDFITDPVGEVIREDKVQENVLTADTTEITVNEPEYNILPDSIEDFPKKKVHDQEVRDPSSNRDKEVTYIQNSEQQENSLWKRIRERESEEFKVKDYLRFVYTKSSFEDFQYDSELEPELDKFIKDIKAGTHSFSDFTAEDLKLFASKIYEFRKN